MLQSGCCTMCMKVTQAGPGAFAQTLQRPEMLYISLHHAGPKASCRRPYPTYPAPVTLPGMALAGVRARWNSRFLYFSYPSYSASAPKKGTGSFSSDTARATCLQAPSLCPISSSCFERLTSGGSLASASSHWQGAFDGQPAGCNSVGLPAIQHARCLLMFGLCKKLLHLLPEPSETWPSSIARCKCVRGLAGSLPAQ